MKAAAFSERREKRCNYETGKKSKRSGIMWIRIKPSSAVIYMVMGTHLINHVFQNQHRNRIGCRDLLPINLRPEISKTQVGRKFMGMRSVIAAVLFFGDDLRSHKNSVSQ